MDLSTALVVLIAGLLLYASVTGPGIEAALDAFGAGFLPYREAGWPRGVQEGEPVPWNWSSMTERGIALADRAPAPDAGIEIIEIDGDSGAEMTGIERGHVSGGTAIRPH